MISQFTSMVLFIGLGLILPMSPRRTENFTKNELILEQEMVKHLKNIKYEATARPPMYDQQQTNIRGHFPVIVKLNIFIVAFSSISVSDNDITLDILLRQIWVDKRLVLKHDFEYLSIGYLKPKIWTPDLFFRNSKKSSLHTVTEPNYMIWLYHDGTVKYSQKLTVTLFCEMNLWNFPMDTQTCRMDLGSYGYPIEDLQFDWWSLNGKHVFFNVPLNLNEFHQPIITTTTCTSYFELTGNFSCLQVIFVLQRKFGFYLFYTYLPSCLIVSISWVAFFIDHTAVPARITLGLLALLALMTQTSTVVEKLPRVSYVKAIDVWMFTCLAFVIVSLFEFAVVNCQARKQDKNKFQNELRQVVKKELYIMGTFLKRKKKQQDSHDKEDNQMKSMLNDDININVESNPEVNIKSSDMRFKAENIDKVFSIWFPVCFLVFNIIYWFSYNRTVLA